MGEEKDYPKKEKKLFTKKPVITSGIILVFAIAGIVGGIVWYIELKEYTKISFIYGTDRGLFILDPFMAYGYQHLESLNILENIAESLFEYEFTSEDSRIVSNLANYGENWSPDGLNFTCSLRTDVKFHDGAPFNATAVKWNFDRLYRLRYYINWDLWTHPDGTPILNFNKTTVIDEYIIRFVLTKPFVPFEALLGRLPLIVSPKSTPPNNFTDFNTGNIIGTGPFRHESTVRIYDPVQESYFTLNTTLLPNRNYWGSKPQFDKIIIKTFDNDTLREEAILSGEIHYTPGEYLNTDVYNNTPGITLTQIIDKTRMYIEMDTTIINTTMRKAIAYALDYNEWTKLCEMYSGGEIILAKSPLPKGMLYSNGTLDLPYYDIEKARQVLKDANWPGTENLTADDDTSPGNDWELVANSLTPLAIFNFATVATFLINTVFAELFHDNLTQIGVKIDIPYVTFPELYNSSQFWNGGWAPDYIDPNDIIAPLYSNSSWWNLYRNYTSDVQIQLWLEDAVKETNSEVRERLYDKIQKRLIEELYFEVGGIYYLIINPFSSDLRGINQYNNFKLLLFKNWYFV